MKKTIILSMASCLAAFFAVGCGTDANRQSVDGSASTCIMTCNIRITGLPEDDVAGRRWEDRRGVCVDVIRARNPDIVCLQEVIYDSYAYVKEKFNDYYAFGFEGPEMDPHTEGYHFIGKNVILFSRERYDMVSAGCYWLSETPVIGGSLSWNSMRARHCNWVRLADRRTGKEFRVLDLHLDHVSDEAKLRQIEMAAQEAAQYAGDFPQIICGDFNSGYLSEVAGTLRAAGWNEMYESIHGVGEAGFTRHSFEGTDYSNGKSRIDFMFFRGGIEALGAEIVRDRIGGVYPSDHFFVKADFRFK